MEAKGSAIECSGKLGEMEIRKKETISTVIDLSCKM
jgi:ribosomal protein S3